LVKVEQILVAVELRDKVALVWRFGNATNGFLQQFGKVIFDCGVKCLANHEPIAGKQDVGIAFMRQFIDKAVVQLALLLPLHQ
jgi:hypothetical protein